MPPARRDNTYAADWTEYFGHQPADGSGDVFFHLDPLWASASVDAVAIDCYWPLADWRDGDNHLDRQTGARSIHDLAYLKSNLFAGEGYDWYYASNADRDAQVRTPITDGAGKPWVFRTKDVRSWWQNAHYNRPGGIESPTPTAWAARSKPIWLTEIGCPAVDKGANQPNVFIDPKSSESFLPYHSRGTRDDLMQRRYLQAILEAFDPASPGYVAGANPVSDVYSGRMLDLDHIHVYAWDARPWPAFPANTDVWGDGPNWRLGHWISGRTAAQPLSAIVQSLLVDYDFTDAETSRLATSITGYVLDRPMSAREALQPFELACFIDAIESDGRIHFRHRGTEGPVLTLSSDEFVEVTPEAPLLSLTRAQETELPASARLVYASAPSDYRQAVAESRRLVGASGRVAQAELAIVMDAEQAAATADTWLFEAWAARDRVGFTLPPSTLALEPGDVVTLVHAGRSRLVRITAVGEHGARDIEALSIDPTIYASGTDITRSPTPSPEVSIGPALGLFLDLPLLTGNEPPDAGWVAAAKAPWPGGVAFYRAPESSGFTLAATARRPAITGTTLLPLAAGVGSRLDRSSVLTVRLDIGTLATVTPLALLGGANVAAAQAPSGAWEVLQFETATLVAPGVYELSTLLRGQAGTEATISDTLPAGSRFVLLDEALTAIPLSRDDIGLALEWRYGPANRDLGDASYVGITHAFAGVGLRPLSPVHVRAQRSAGNLTITWIRRTRLGGDSWIATEVPLAEDAERWEVDILSGTTVVRTLTATTPSVVYTAADQTTDFGSPQSAIAIRIHQLGALGRGTPRSAIV